VDDEPEVLNGLKRMLRSQRGEWSCAYAESGQKALDILAGSGPFDLIISDMRMPGMDGARLLEKVRALYPRMVRIILSGQSDQNKIMNSVKPAHQFLAKPIKQEALLAILKRALALQAVLADESLAELLSEVESLPGLPEVYTKLMEEIESEESSLEAIGSIIEQDMGMTATLLKVVNSAFFGIPRKIEKPAQAVSLLGLDVVKALVLSYQLFSAFDLRRIKSFSFDLLWRHSVATGGLAKLIAQEEGLDRSSVDDAFFAGMLHDVGKLPLAAYASEQYNRVLNQVREADQLLWEAEMEVLGTSHAEAGAFLMGLWGMPESAIIAIAFHHRPSHIMEEGFSPLTAVHAANILEHQLVVHNQNYALPQWDMEHLARLGLENRIPAWTRACEANLGQEDADD
jgi:HD-like signal output (HDOD) protein/CheY-like chemotaxis protein